MVAITNQEQREELRLLHQEMLTAIGEVDAEEYEEAENTLRSADINYHGIEEHEMYKEFRRAYEVILGSNLANDEEGAKAQAYLLSKTRKIGDYINYERR